jgi:hypothetical protein
MYIPCGQYSISLGVQVCISAGLISPQRLHSLMIFPQVSRSAGSIQSQLPALLWDAAQANHRLLEVS